MSSATVNPVILKANQPSRRHNEKYLSWELVPGYLTIACITILCFLWAGVKPIGFDVAHFFSFLSLACSMKVGHLTFRKLKKFPFLKPILLLQALVLINLFIKKSPALGWDMWIMGWDCLIVLLVISNTPRRFMKQLFLMFCFVGAFLALIHTLLVIMGKMSHPSFGFIKHGYHYGVFALFILFPSMGAFFSSHRTLVRYAGISTAVLNLLYLMIDSKTGSLGIAILGVFLFGMRARRFSTKNMKIFVVIVIAVTGFAALNLTDWFIRDVYSTLQLDNPLDYHWFPMRTAIKAGVSNPGMGLGAGNYRYLSGVYRQSGILKHFYRAHNSYLEFFAETGFVITGVFIFVVFGLLKNSFTLSRKRQVSRWIHRGFKLSLGLVAFAALWDFGPQLPANLLACCFGIGFLIADRPRMKNTSESKTGKLWLIPVCIAFLAIPGIAGGFMHAKGEVSEQNLLYRSASKEYEMASRLAPYDDRFSASAAMSKAQLGMISHNPELIDDAIQWLSKALNQNPNQADLQYERALLISAYSIVTDPPWEESLKIAYQLDPTDHRIAVPYAYVLAKSGDYAGAESILSQSMDLLSFDEYQAFAKRFCDVWTDPERLGAFVLQSRGKIPDDLIVFLLEALQQQGLDILVREISESIFTDLMKDDSVELSPGVRVKWVRLLFRAKLVQEAFSVVSYYERIDPESLSTAHLCSVGGSYYRRLRQFEDALFWYEKALMLGLDDLEFMLKYIMVNRQLNRGYRTYNELIKLNNRFPNSPMVHYELAKEYERRNETLKALDEFRKANQLSDNQYLIEQRQTESKLEIPNVLRED